MAASWFSRLDASKTLYNFSSSRKDFGVVYTCLCRTEKRVKVRVLNIVAVSLQFNYPILTSNAASVLSKVGIEEGDGGAAIGSSTVRIRLRES